MVRLILLITSIILSLSFAAPLPTSSSVAIADSLVLSAIPDPIVIERDASAAVIDNTGVGGSGFRLKGGATHRR
ncbi:hypothetical protein HYFRA_00008229 [Hymenoscyphus fraxineus]|uniref:Uncharacterized protein n=1 Tax=Hymenoscyphus fraxineus TaxID=746836 RepID=A0A9N9L6S6_9HELO|nr:hypothetical protein HYFRA_00008229 [Hymenoscyphus fraxineus]